MSFTWRRMPTKAERVQSKFEVVNHFSKISSAVIQEENHRISVIFWGTPFKLFCHMDKSWTIHRLSKANKSLIYTKETKYINGISISLEEALDSSDMPKEIKRAIVFHLNEF